MRQSTHNYNSKAHIDYIKNYHFEYEEGSLQESVFALRMPVIIQSDNSIWELANIYLQHLLINKSVEQSTLESTANGLVDYLRFMEHVGLDILHLPVNQYERVTYRYNASLHQRIRKGLLRPSTANGKMNKVLRFYDFCLDNQLFHKDSLRNAPYEEIKKRITCFTKYGRPIDFDINSSDLAISVSKRQIPADTIIDGGELHPLTDTEQEYVKQYLQETSSREFQLMCYLALFTGARIQTICTLRVFNIKELKEKNPDPFDDAYTLIVGSTTIVDTKNGTKLTIKIPSWLVNELIAYSNSKAWKKRARLSYYGISDQNYLFLSARGNSYYTSLKEIEDRRSSNSLQGFNFSRGLSVRIHIKQMLKKLNTNEIKVNHFTFHDLRATFGINTLKIMLSCGFGNDQALIYLKERMGHRSINTTIRYLEHATYTSNFINANTSFSESLNRLSNR
ncbi:tyrosine-type recombinase/integrase [Acinetobacter lactucae]|uniref:tyrosine-type recombinase/integrase n=1 Tax=Acinetobacter lactucae TaxID=1785128 RepID=UPI0015F46F27|nr:site-specific integrase [Acinetobacter lactucae]